MGYIFFLILKGGATCAAVLAFYSSISATLMKGSLADFLIFMVGFEVIDLDSFLTIGYII